EILRDAKKQWARQRDKLASFGTRLGQAVRSQYEYSDQSIKVERRQLDNAVRAYASAYDAEWGGLGIVPKFPMAHTLTFLLRQGSLANDPKAVAMAETTLTRMCEGGVFDHVGGGFMRYATDRAWAVPHFEKMLGDNALLADAYLEAWEATNRSLYRGVAERTLQYVLREMTDEEGGFFSSQDADAQGREGAYYELTREELTPLLGKEDAAAYVHYYNLSQYKLPNRIGFEGGIETRRMASLNEVVREYRAGRMPLTRDDKQLTVWNAQMIAAMAHAYHATGEGVYLHAAVRAAQTVRKRLQKPDGSLYIHWLNGKPGGEGLLDDYASLANAALALYRITLEDSWLAWAVSLSRTMLERFCDREKGGFFLTPHSGEKLIARPKETYDGSQPSGNAMALSVLVTLAILDIGEGWIDAVEKQMDFVSILVADAPLQHMASLTAAMPLIYPTTLLDAHASPVENHTLLASFRGKYAPMLFLKATLPGVSGSTWRLCKGRTCLTPFQNLEQVLANL
ncbi:MAG: hypothetical protein FWF69_00470, partial [Firmicutes bacterium]|nr:hypothetical protein [Bacillota bacterium]